MSQCILENKDENGDDKTIDGKIDKFAFADKVQEKDNPKPRGNKRDNKGSDKLK